MEPVLGIAVIRAMSLSRNFNGVGCTQPGYFFNP